MGETTISTFVNGRVKSNQVAPAPILLPTHPHVSTLDNDMNATPTPTTTNNNNNNIHDDDDIVDVVDVNGSDIGVNVDVASTEVMKDKKAALNSEGLAKYGLTDPVCNVQDEWLDR